MNSFKLSGYFFSSLFFLLLANLSAQNTSPFITTWKTDNSGVSGNNQIIIPTNPAYSYNYTVDWGDGVIETVTTQNKQHTYATPGTYEVKITGDFPSFFLNNQADRLKLISVDSWGNIPWATMERAFYGAENMELLAQDIPYLDSVKSMSKMFMKAISMTADSSSISIWNVQNVENMSQLFDSALVFNAPIGSWNVEEATNMSEMFQYAQLFNQELNNWDVSKVTNMSFMFSQTKEFDQPLDEWSGKLLNVTDMGWMFQGAQSFNQDISGWDLRNLVTASGMFAWTMKFNQNIGSWWQDSTSVKYMVNMFRGAKVFNNSISNWNVSKVTDMSGMFELSETFNQPLNWNVGSVKKMTNMFGNSKAFDQNIGMWNIANVKDMTGMFTNAYLSLNHYDSLLIGWATSAVLDSIVLDAPNCYYDKGNQARDFLIDSLRWLINDAGTFYRAPFITTWKTISINETVSIPIVPSFSYEYTVDWGDGSPLDSLVKSAISHEYASAGQYEVKIYGKFPAIKFNNSGDRLKLVKINQWGNIRWKSFSGAFYGCEKMELWAIDSPDLSEVNVMTNMFRSARIMTAANTSIGQWDVSHVSRMDALFCDARNFNEDLSDWEVSNVTNMSSMFNSSWKFNQDLSQWGNKLKSVTRMDGLFHNALVFNGDISGWQVENVTSMRAMFLNAAMFNKNISSWDVSNVTDMYRMFYNADSFTADITNWDVGKVTNMLEMFKNNETFNQDISAWDVSSVTNMAGMFSGATAFNQNLGDWEINKVANMDQMFTGMAMDRPKFDSTIVGWVSHGPVQENVVFGTGENKHFICTYILDSLVNNLGWIITPALDSAHNIRYSEAFVTTWKTTNIMAGSTNDHQVKIPTYGSYSYDFTIDWGDGVVEQITWQNPLHTYADTGTYKISIVGNFPAIHCGSRTLDEMKLLSVENWGHIHWNTFNEAFSGAINLEIFALDTPNLENVTRMDYAFYACKKMNADLSAWNVSNVQSMVSTFDHAEKFDQNLNGWNVSNVLKMSSMFAHCYEFNGNISDWNVSKVQTMNSMFARAYKFEKDLKDWEVSSVVDMNGMFMDTWNFNGNIADWDVSNVRFMQYMFRGARSFNQDISAWDVSKAISMFSMFYLDTAFDQNLHNWKPQQVLTMVDMFRGNTLSTSNYDSLLIGWAALDTIQVNVVFDGGKSKYCSGTGARSYLTDSLGWTITDGGLDPNCNNNARQTAEGLVIEDNPVAVVIYPVPARNRLSVMVPGEEVEFVQVMNLSGQVMKSFERKADDLDIADLADGTYLIHVFWEGGSYRQLIIKDN